MTQRWLMADHQHRKLRLGPACGFEQVARGGVRRDRVHGAQFPVRDFSQRRCGLLGAHRRAHENPSAVGQMPVEPFGRATRLLLAARSELTGEVGLAIFRFGVTPEY